MYLNADVISRRITVPHGKIIVFDDIDSTNGYAKRRFAVFDNFTVICAVKQSSGRGRLGRSFISPEGGVYFSVLIKNERLLANIKTITPCAGICVAESIGDLCKINVGIKWVNDLLINNKKVCGILCESVFTNEDLLSGVICGIGVNLKAPAGGFPPEIRNTAGSISDHADPPDPSVFVADVVNRLYCYLSGEKDIYMRKYRERSIVIGKNITVVNNNAASEAFVLDVLPDGELLVEYSDKTRAILNSGEISIRFKEDINE